MSQELLYTSAPRGLKPGSRGFCTVLSTQGMVGPLATALEGLSGYRPLFATGDPNAVRNPIVYSHVKLQSAGRTWNVLSRIADFGLDYSQRSNKLAHHVVLDKSDFQVGGPANLLSTPGFLRTDWHGEPKLVPNCPAMREVHPRSGVSVAWEQITGDAGWAGVLAESFLREPDRLVILLFAPGQEILPLFAEAIALLPPERRWDVTFSTYFTGLLTGTTCCWRGMVHDSKEAHDSLRFVNALRLDLTDGSLGLAPPSLLVEAARRGGHADCFAPQEAGADQRDQQVQSTVNRPDVNAASQGEAGSVSADQDGPIRIARIPARPPRLIRRLGDEALKERRSRRSYLGLAVGIGVIVLSSCVAIWVWLFSARESNNRSVASSDRPTIPSSDNGVQTSKGLPPIAPVEQANSTPTSTPPRAEFPPKPDLGHSLSEADSSKHSSTGTTTDTGDAPKPQTPTMDPTSAPAGLAKAPTSVEPTPVPKKTLPSRKKPITLELPIKDGKPVLVYTIPATVAKPVNILLFKPNWLPYETGKPRTNTSDKTAKLAVVVPGTADNVQVALFTDLSLNSSFPKIQLKSLNDEHVKWLGWCRIQVVASDPIGTVLENFAFSDFPLDVNKLERIVRKGTATKWYLPATAPVEVDRLPQIVLGRLSVAINDHVFRLEGLPDRSQSTWIIPLDEFGQKTYASFNSKAAFTNATLKLSLVPRDKTGAAIDLRIEGKDKFLHPLHELLESELFALSKALPALCKGVDAELSTLIDDQLRNVAISTKSPTEQSHGLNPALKAKIDAIRRDASKKTDDNFAAAFNEVVTKVESLEKLLKRIEDFRLVSAGLDAIKVTSARLYYVVHDTRKMSDASMEVDIVDFETDVAKEPEQAAPQTTTGGTK